jgi:hypothetical protein
MLGPHPPSWSYLQRAARSHLWRTAYAITARTTSTTASHIQTKSPPVADANHSRTRRFGEFNLEGRVIAVTGGGRGLGLAMAEVLMEAGAKG